MKLIHFILFFQITNIFAQQYEWDSTFGVNGKTITNFGGMQFAGDGKLGKQSDGKYILIGKLYYSNTRNASFDIIISRYTTLGKLDSTFGANGKIVIDYNFSDDRIVDFAIQSDDKILLCTQIRKSTSTIENNIYRFSKDGKPDSSFGSNGIVNNGFSMTDMILTQDNNIIVAGAKTTNGNENLAFTKYNSNGTKVSSFGTNGDLILDFGTNEVCTAFDTLSNGDFVALGVYGNGQQINDILLTKFSKNGTLYTNFGILGKTILSIAESDFMKYIKIQKNDKIIVTGSSAKADGTFVKGFNLLRFMPDGKLDSSYGKNGILNTDNPVYIGPLSIELDSFDNLFVLGLISNKGNSIALLQLNPDGNIKLNFGDSGIVNFIMDSCSITPSMSTLQHEGKIIVSGFLNKKNAVAELFIARFKKSNLNTSTELLNKLKYFKIYPNPVNGYLTIETSDNNSTIQTILIHDIYGRILYNCSENSNATQIDVSALSPGQYFISVNNTSRIFIKN